jgi:hypothetical protein
LRDKVCHLKRLIMYVKCGCYGCWDFTCAWLNLVIVVNKVIWQTHMCRVNKILGGENLFVFDVLLLGKKK